MSMRARIFQTFEAKEKLQAINIHQMFKCYHKHTPTIGNDLCYIDFVESKRKNKYRFDRH